MGKLTIGEVEVQRVVELQLPTAMWWMLPDAPDDAVERHREWMEPFVNEKGHMIQNMQTFVVRADGLTILVDTGIGNDKVREGGAVPAFHMLDTDYLDRLADLGVTPESVDYVLITHMHGDHCGWNTRLIDDEWVPTFTNARTLFVRPEWEHWEADARSAEGNALVEDSLRPVYDVGLVDIVEADHVVSPSIRLEPSHGHSPGHVCVRITSGDDEAVITGDVMHTAIQCAYPDPQPKLDSDAEPARLARRAFLERYADTGITVLGTHIGGPSAGLISAEGDAYRLDAIEGL